MTTATANRRTFIERAAPSSAVRVDHEAGVIRGAKLVGMVSDNGCRHPLPVLRAAMSRYEGARINMPHGNPWRTYEPG